MILHTGICLMARGTIIGFRWALVSGLRCRSQANWLLATALRMSDKRLTCKRLIANSQLVSRWSEIYYESRSRSVDETVGVYCVWLDLR